MIASQKFAKNIMVDTYLRGVDCETYKPSNLPCLTNEPGAMNSYLLKDSVTETIAKFSNVENSTHCHQQWNSKTGVRAKTDFQKNLPNYFKKG